MLGIGKIRPDRMTYHLDAVADGVEDYYFSPNEAPGLWMGGGARSLGLSGTVTREQLLRLLQATHPATGLPMGTSTQMHGGRQALPGFDVSLSAPKSVSLLWGLTTHDGLRHEVQAAHDAAVVGSLTYLEQVAALGRRGSHGATRIATSGFTAAAFRHRTSRAGDPVLHTHLVIPNVVQGVDGRWSAPEGRLLYANGKSAGYVYQALLRGELTQRLGVAWDPVRNGYADLVGTSSAVIRAFSRRRQDIEGRREVLARERGDAAAAAVAAGPPTTVTATEVGNEAARAVRQSGTTAQLAALETRRGKELGIDMPAIVDEWRDRAQRLGFTESELRSQLGQQSLVPITVPLYETMASRLTGEPAWTGERLPDFHLAARNSTFERRDAVMGWCSQFAQGAVSVRQITDLADHFLQTSPAIVHVTRQRGGPSALATPQASARYTTRLMRAMETALIDAATARAGERTAIVHPHAIDAAVATFAAASGTSLTGAQVAAVRHMTASGKGIDVVVGHAGTGKTTALRVARDAWEASGIPVAGSAKAAAAARNLELATGIPSRTLDSLLLQVNADPRRWPLPAGGVLVVDEAATVETRTMFALLDAAERARWKVVLVGDDHQLREIDAGGGFRGLRERLGAVVLDENLRQRSPWEREAISLVREGRGIDALRAYVDHGRVTIAPRRDGALAHMVDRWWERRDSGTELLQARRNVDVADLNRLVHDRRVAAGEVSGDVIRLGDVEVAAGDRVLTRLASSADGVINGLRGEVVRVPVHGESSAGMPEAPALTVRLDDGSLLEMGAAYLRRTTEDGLPALDLAYATTVHRNQGATAERSQVLVDSGMTGDAMYVALSRGRATNDIVIVADHPAGAGFEHWAVETSPRHALEICARAIGDTDPKHLSLDHPFGVMTERSEPDDAGMDAVVAAWRRSTNADVGIPGRVARTMDVDLTPAAPRSLAPLEETPHLLAIGRLLAESRVDVISASERYEAWCVANIGPRAEEEDDGPVRFRAVGGPISGADDAVMTSSVSASLGPPTVK